MKNAFVAIWQRFNTITKTFHRVKKKVHENCSFIAVQMSKIHVFHQYFPSPPSNSY